jgi:hypothetical protein
MVCSTRGLELHFLGLNQDLAFKFTIGCCGLIKLTFAIVGMILFPLGQPIFEKLGSAGISMFYISCIISQLVYSLGGSRFKGGVGSEMVSCLTSVSKSHY